MNNRFQLELMEEYVRHPSRKLQAVKPGLVKMVYPFKGNPNQDLGWKLPPELARGVTLPNDLLCYNYWLRSEMKARQFHEERCLEAFMGPKVRDDYIERIEGDTIYLNDSFLTTNKQNLCVMLVPANSPLFMAVIMRLNQTLAEAGFNINTSTWEDYKEWKKARFTTPSKQ